MANVHLTGFAFFLFISSALSAFRYRSDSAYYNFSSIGDDTNWFKLGDSVRLYGGLVIGLTLSATSVMTLLDPAYLGLSLTFWKFMLVFNAIVSLIQLLGYDAAYKHITGSDATKKTSGQAV